MPESPRDTAPLVDRYVRENRIALEVFHDAGHRPFHGVSRRTLRAFARRGLVWFEHDNRGGLTDRGRASLAELESADEDEDRP
jgi:hypothetical protein